MRSFRLLGVGSRKRTVLRRKLNERVWISVQSKKIVFVNIVLDLFVLARDRGGGDVGSWS